MTPLLLIASLASAGSIWERAGDARDDAAALSADPWSRVAMEQLIGDLVSAAAVGSVPEGAADRAGALGFVLERPSEDLLVLAPASPSGAGLYAIRIGGDAPALLLQAPHAWYDRDTGAVASALFEAGYGRALFLNTTHRYRRRDEGEQPEAERIADLAHREDTLFQAATLGASWALERPLVVQLHGFGDSHGE